MDLNHSWPRRVRGAWFPTLKTAPSSCDPYSVDSVDFALVLAGYGMTSGWLVPISGFKVSVTVKNQPRLDHFVFFSFSGGILNWNAARSSIVRGVRVPLALPYFLNKDGQTDALRNKGMRIFFNSI